MTRLGRTSKVVAASLGGALVLSACGSSDGDDSDDNGSAGGGGGSIAIAEGTEWTTWNPTTADGNVGTNSNHTYWVTTGFWIYGDGGEVTPNPEFGSYEQVSEDPLIIEYSIADEATWSDGESINCADVLLWWSQNGGYLPWSTPGTSGIEDTLMPECEYGDKDFTLEYRQPFADWENSAPGQGNNSMMPAHIVAEQGGLDGPEELIDIISGVDWESDAADEQAEEAAEQLSDAIDFFQDGWVVDGGLPDEELIPSSGPFTFDTYQPGEQTTLVPNEEYWGETPGADEIVFRYIEEDAQSQALENREIDVMAPQPTVDLADQLERLEGVETEVFEQFLYEHNTFNMESGPFADSLELRQAWMKCVPRETLVENLIRPLDDEAEPRDSLIAHPLEDRHDQVAGTIPDEYAEQDIDGARQILEDEDAVGQEVRLRTLDNPRRNAQNDLIQDACNEAGFEVDAEAHGDFFDTGNGALYTNEYEVAMAAFSGSPVTAGWNSTYRTPSECSASGKGNNNGCYSDDHMDQLLDEVLRIVDEDEKDAKIAEISEALWTDGVAIPLFNHPGLAAWADDLNNIVPNPAQSDIVWNMPEWSRG